VTKKEIKVVQLEQRLCQIDKEREQEQRQMQNEKHMLKQ
jgi:hypothetical protein